MNSHQGSEIIVACRGVKIGTSDPCGVLSVDGINEVIGENVIVGLDTRQQTGENYSPLHSCFLQLPLRSRSFHKGTKSNEIPVWNLLQSEYGLLCILDK